jgi:hypothetical protein
MPDDAESMSDTVASLMIQYLADRVDDHDYIAHASFADGYKQALHDAVLVWAAYAEEVSCECEHPDTEARSGPAGDYVVCNSCEEVLLEDVYDPFPVV